MKGLCPAVLLALACFTPLTVRAGDKFVSGEAVSRPAYRMDQWTAADGLPQNNVQALLQTRDGYIWIGTWFGLARYDGARFVIFNENNIPEMMATSDNAICLAEDAAGSLWIGTANGLLRYEDFRFDIFTTTNGLPGNRVWALAPAGPRGGMWIGTETGLAFHDRDRLLDLSEQIGEVRLRTLSADSSGSAYVVSKGRLLRCARGTGRVESLLELEGKSGGGEPSVFVDSSDHVWLGTRRGLFLFEEGALRRFAVSDWEGEGGNYPNQVSWIEEGRDGGLWLGLGSEQAAARFEDEKIVKAEGFPDSPGLSITSFLEDREGNLWAGSHGEGLFLLTPNRVTMLQTGDPRADDLGTVAEDAEGNIWAGGRHGISRWTGSHFTRWTEWSDESGPRPAVRPFPGAMSLVACRNGLVYAGTDGRGIWFWDGGDWKRCQIPALPQDRQSKRYGAPVIEDSRRGIWFRRREPSRVLRWDGEALENLELPDNSRNKHVRALFQAEDGSMWIGSGGGGLIRHRGGIRDHFTTRNGLSDNRVTVIRADDSGALWVGTERGLNRVKDGAVFAFFVQHGLFDNMVNNLLEDDFGYFWISCNRGIYRVRRADLNAVADGRLERVNYVAYGEADGMATAETNGEHQTAGCKTRDGRLLFPTGKGLVVIDPAKIQDNEIPPPVVIESIVAGGETVFGRPSLTWPAPSPQHRSRSQGTEAGLTIRPGQAHVLRIAYTANSFTDPRKVRFRYFLEGYDKTWRDAGESGAERVVHYTNLRPGSYTFRVIAANNHGYWNEEGASLAFYVAPHFYQTWPFFIGCGLAALGAGAFVHGRRTLRLEAFHQLERALAIERERTRIAEDMHDDVGSRLSEIGLLGNIVEREARAGDASAEKISRIVEAAEQTSQALEEIVWAVSPRNDNPEHLVGYLSQYAEAFLQSAGIRCRVEIGPDWPDCLVSSEVRHALFLVLKEALQNIRKHAEASEVRLQFARSGKLLQISISDNGIGISSPGQKNIGLGVGLGSMKHRMHRAGGSIYIQNNPSSGTTLRLQLPLSRT